MAKFNFNFEDISDAATALSVLDGMTLAQQKEFVKSEYGQVLIKAAKATGETYSSENLKEHPARGTEGKKKHWKEAVEAATQHGKKKASYGLSQYIKNKMDK
jgi:hypothetical protein